MYHRLDLDIRFFDLSSNSLICNNAVLIEERWTSCPCNVQLARELIRKVACDYPSCEADLIELAIGEACANAIEHGSPYGSNSHFVLRCLIKSDHSTLIFEVEDEGMDFALTNLTLSHTPDLESEGGRGLYIINQIMDEVSLHSTPKGLIVRMIKHLSSFTIAH